MGTDRKIKIGLTMGDPSGIGPEVLIKAVCRLKDSMPVHFVIIGAKNILEIYLHKLKINFFFDNKFITLINLKNVDTQGFKYGINQAQYGKASLEYLDKAIALFKEKKISALVTAPVSKTAINFYRRNFLGHTEYLARAFSIKNFLMMMLNKYLRVVPLTRHIALKRVPRKINYSIIHGGIKLTAEYLGKYFSIPVPRIAVCALNPHVGEAGFMGREEQEIIIPAIRDLNRKIKAKVEGPFPADGLFAHYKKEKFDCIVGMYHDQVLIPVKMFDCQKTVNLTLGLPFVRTSPGHGTAFDIAGRGIASPASMIAAIKLAYQLSRNVIS